MNGMQFFLTEAYMVSPFVAGSARLIISVIAACRSAPDSFLILSAVFSK